MRFQSAVSGGHRSTVPRPAFSVWLIVITFVSTSRIQGESHDPPCRLNRHVFRGPIGASAGPDSMCTANRTRIVVEMVAANNCPNSSQFGFNHGRRIDCCLVIQEEPPVGTRTVGAKSASWT